MKQLQEELKCERKNAESCRLQHQQRVKELEKQHHRVGWRLPETWLNFLKFNWDFIMFS